MSESPPGKQRRLPASSHEKKLQLELKKSHKSQQHTIEELDASREEMQSINKEMQSTNEKLQSTNEELETSKEELQSINHDSPGQSLLCKFHGYAMVDSGEESVAESLGPASESSKN